MRCEGFIARAEEVDEHCERALVTLEQLELVEGHETLLAGDKASGEAAESKLLLTVGCTSREGDLNLPTLGEESRKLVLAFRERLATEEASERVVRGVENDVAVNGQELDVPNAFVMVRGIGREQVDEENTDLVLVERKEETILVVQTEVLQEDIGVVEEELRGCKAEAGEAGRTAKEASEQTGDWLSENTAVSASCEVTSISMVICWSASFDDSFSCSLASPFKAQNENDIKFMVQKKKTKLRPGNKNT